MAMDRSSASVAAERGGLMIRLFLPISPQPKLRPRLGRNGAYTPQKTKQYESAVAMMLRAQYKQEPILGAIRAKFVFYMGQPKKKVREHHTVRPDLDNLIKAVKDAANGILWKDDSQIVALMARKLYDWTDKRVGIDIELERIG
jgi:Holliday junction resolvase RusA-like endonuclease